MLMKPLGRAGSNRSSLVIDDPPMGVNLLPRRRATPHAFTLVAHVGQETEAAETGAT